MNDTIKNDISVLNRLKSALNQRWHFFFLLLIIFSSFFGCAVKQQPTGGPKDSIPPKVLEMIPSNMTKNFDADEISITFDEYVKLQNEFTEISLSPDVETLPIYRIKKKSLLIRLPDSLEENTTYTINFGKAIADFNESNELRNFSYVFSTGPEIDSLSISGSVGNALTHEIEKDVTVLLIPTRQDSIFGKKKANIYTRTDSSGNFSLRNLREDTYRIYALKETNNDRIFNGFTEEIGFLKDSIYLAKDTSGIKLQIFKEEPAAFRLLDRRIDNKGKITLAFNKSIENPVLTILNENELDENKIVEYTHGKDTAFIWLPSLTFDSLDISINQSEKALDTAKIKRNKKDDYDRNIVLTDNLNNRRVDKQQNIIVTGSAPIKSVDLNKINLIEDTISRPNFQLSLDTMNKRQVYIRYNWKTQRQYTIEFQEGAFTGYFGEKSSAGQRKFTYDDTENYGDITLNVIVPDSNNHYIIELLNDKGSIINSKSITATEKIAYRSLPGAKYGVRIIYDDNVNKKWDSGNVLRRVQPEKIWYWDKVITIRPNWEQEETVTIPDKVAKIQLKEPKIESEKVDSIIDSTENTNLKSIGRIEKIENK